jgi:hypothetical protein
MSEGEQAYRAGWITLTADHELWKHVKWPHLRRDGTVNSSAYLLNGQPDPSISVDIAEMTTFQDVRKRRGPSIGVGILMAGYPLNAMQLTLRHEPTVGPPAGDNQRSFSNGVTHK